MCWGLGCSLHCHAGGHSDGKAGVEQRREACALLHDGHPDLQKGKQADFVLVTRENYFIKYRNVQKSYCLTS